MTMRAFLAVPLPEEVRNRVAEAARLFPGLVALKPPAIHLTVRFLGDIEDPAPIIDALRPIVATHPAFEIEIAGLGAFPKRQEASIVWAGLSKGGLAAGVLAAGIEAALVPVGFPREARPWKGHVTIGRFASPKRLRRAIFETESPFGSAPVEKVVLYQSTLTPEGAIHEPLAELPLGGGA